MWIENESGKRPDRRPVRGKSLGVAYALWLILGVFGAHRFYLGSFPVGLAQVCLLILALVTPGEIEGRFVLSVWAVCYLADLWRLPRLAMLARTDPLAVPLDRPAPPPSVTFTKG
ncbi:TM2 domain-containing protein [Jannaschia rubra]|uniref:TM2 domain-containing protein n=1 Tax=Jannaschia rubra TaxID=282197 RepID=UPI0024909E71|nr:TM2 domain-containing protein [Jannaschia rubra]